MNHVYTPKAFSTFFYNGNLLRKKLSNFQFELGRLNAKVEKLSALTSERFFTINQAKIIQSSAEMEGENYCLNYLQESLQLTSDEGLPFQLLNNKAIAEKQMDGHIKCYTTAMKIGWDEISTELLHEWQQSLFPYSRSGTLNIVTGFWRLDGMAVKMPLKGEMHKKKELLKGVRAKEIGSEMEQLLRFIGTDCSEDPLIKYAITLLVFQLVRPYEDGNFRIATLLSEKILKEAHPGSSPISSLPDLIVEKKDKWLDFVLEVEQGKCDLTEYLQWFISMAFESLIHAEKEMVLLELGIDKWEYDFELNPRHCQILFAMLNEERSSVNAEEWSDVTKVSINQAKDDLAVLLKMEILRKQTKGKKVNYALSNGQNKARVTTFA